MPLPSGFQPTSEIFSQSPAVIFDEILTGAVGDPQAWYEDLPKTVYAGRHLIIGRMNAREYNLDFNDIDDDVRKTASLNLISEVLAFDKNQQIIGVEFVNPVSNISGRAMLQEDMGEKDDARFWFISMGLENDADELEVGIMVVQDQYTIAEYRRFTEVDYELVELQSVLYASVIAARVLIPLERARFERFGAQAYCESKDEAYGPLPEE